MARRYSCVIAMTVAVGLGTPAAALKKVATYTGTVASGSDPAGLFGTSGADLTGKAFTAIYAYDTVAGVRFTQPSADVLQSGTAFSPSVANAFSAATLTIDGVTRDLPRTFYTLAQVVQPNGQVLHQTAGDTYANSLTYNLLSVPGMTSLDSNLPTTAGMGGTGSFRFGFGGKGDFNTVDPAETIEASGTFFTETLTITGDLPAANVMPEPETWALFVVGFGLVGGAVRTRRLAATG